MPAISAQKDEACCTRPAGGFKVTGRKRGHSMVVTWRDKMWRAPGSDWHRV